MGGIGSGVTRRAFGAAALGATAGVAAPVSARPRAAFRDTSLAVDARVDDLLRRMTLEEKVAQMLCVWLTKTDIIDAQARFSPAKAKAAWPHGLGMIARPSDRVDVKPMGSAPNRSPADTAAFIAEAQRWAMEETRLGIPLFLHEEALHGLVAPAATSFPQAIALASTFDPALVERAFALAGREAAVRGANLVLAPVIDVARDPRWGRIEETYGEDPHLTTRMGLAAIRGLQGTALPLAPDKVLVTLKHFTGHGQPENGTNTGPAQIAERTLCEEFFPPFKAAIEALPVRAVMASYNEIDGVPSHANKWLLGDVLRGEWGFKGVIVSDYDALGQLLTRHHLAADKLGAARRALAAGVDSETPDPDVFKELAAWVRAGEIAEADVDRAVRRILTVKVEAGLFERPYPRGATAERQTGTPAGAALARELAVRAAVLLTNRNDTLPLDPARLKRLAVIGPNAADLYLGGYSDRPRRGVPLLDGVRAAAADRFAVDHAEGVRITEGGHDWYQDRVTLADPAENRRRIAEAVAVARGADAIVLAIGDNEQTSREAWSDDHLGDRASLDLVGQQQELVDAMAALGKPLVVVLINGRPLSVTKVAGQADALLEMWYPGEQGGHAIADILFGRRSPGGKLPVSFARHVGQLPVHYRRKPSARRGYLFEGTAPLFPFGHGLSCSRFEIDAPRLSRPTIGVSDDVEAVVTVRNVGGREADEVVQLYIRDEVASVTRPILELKGFERVTLKPGEARDVRFTLRPDDLALWDGEMRRVVEPGRFAILAGPNSVELKEVTLTVA